MAGRRTDMREMALYTVRDGKISEARFSCIGEGEE
jgi:ketosteroid isomerase-like protein